MKMENLELKHTYLIQIGLSDTIASITVLMITKKAYYIHWNDDNGSTSWELKYAFHHNWNIIEDISDYGVSPASIMHQEKKSEIEYIQCSICHGEGTVPDFKSTVGKTICPYCLGAKMIPKSLKRKTNL